MSNKNLLVELFVEELPPKALKRFGESFATTLVDTLKAQGLAAADAVATSFASPRRLAVHITNVAAKAAEKSVSQKLMPVAVGLDASGQATPALLKKLAGLGADTSVVPKLKRQSDGKAEALFYDSVQQGIALVDGLQKALEEALAKLPIPKVMGYQLQDGWTTVNFVRPAHKLVALHGEDVIGISVLGLQAGRETLGHRFEAKISPVVLKNADSYAEQLEREGAVIASFADRRAEISLQLKAAAQKVGEGSTPIQDDALLDEVTALVERPNVLIGQFEERFLEVPQECLILTMKANQKYFPLLDANGKLTNKFLIVSNIRPDDASEVVGGNERVVRPRLADAKFFFDQDRKKTLESRVDGLVKVTYLAKFGDKGSLRHRVERVREIACAIAQLLGVDAGKTDTAARLAKADLLTDMVGEFPELQGVMGGYYAKCDGLGDTIADAIEDHYKPRFAGDVLPRNDIGMIVALADKLETLVGLFGIGQIPTGDKDPFALRRHALGVIRILRQIRQGPSNRTDLSLTKLLNITERSFSAVSEFDQTHVAYQVTAFIFERFTGVFRDEGFSPQEIASVLQSEGINSIDFEQIHLRLEAVQTFARLPEAPALAAANKRVGNILKKVEGEVPIAINTSLLKEPAEQALAEALASIVPQANAAFDAGDYTASLQALAALKAPVDAFFESVMVNADDPALRNNRLALLSQLYNAMNRVADLSKLST